MKKVSRHRWIVAATMMAFAVVSITLLGCVPGGTPPQLTSTMPSRDEPRVTKESPSPTPSPSISSGRLQIDEQTQPHIVLFRNVVAGDYNVLLILASGQVEFINWNRLNQIILYKRGNVGPEKVVQIFQLLADAGFYQLENEYDIYPLPDGDTRVYEDVYYLVKVKSEEQEKIVVAHEQAQPPNLAQIVNAVLDPLQQMPETPAKGNFIMAGDYEILRYKRFVIGQSDYALQLSEQELDQYPLLKQALSQPFSLIPAQDLNVDQLGRVLSTEQTAVEVDLKDKRFDVLFLMGGTN